MGCSHSVQRAQDNRSFFDGYIRDGTRRLRETVHTNARQSPYQGGGPSRVSLDDADVSWCHTIGNYVPQDYTAPSVAKGPVWADKEDTTGVVFNQYDAKSRVDRTSYEGAYRVTKKGMPLNPRGRTGLAGRGLLGRFGPNHAADPVITKWCRDANGKLKLNEVNEPILEFVAIKRKDTGDWAIPGGMVDAGENVSFTLKREFGEETMASMELPAEEYDALMKDLDVAFQNGVPVYRGYVDDIRNTDNAWMETTCVNFHDEDGTTFGKFKLKSGDDAGDVAWTAYYEGIPLYATHSVFLSTIHRMRVAWHKHKGSKNT